MSEDVPPVARQIERLRDLNVELRRRLELAETQIPLIDEALERLKPLGLYPARVFLGGVVLTRPYEDENYQDSELVVAATFVYGQGFGATYWDMEEYQAYRRQAVPTQEEALRKFRPFRDLEPGVKALLTPHVGGLLARICDEVVPRDFRDSASDAAPE